MERKKNFIINTLYYGMICVGLYGACKYLLPVIAPFLIAFLLASVFQIPAKKLAGGNEKVRKIIAVMLSGTFFALTLIVFIVLGTQTGARI